MGFEQLIRLGHLEDVKTLALRLMKAGSYQVECSDKGGKIARKHAAHLALKHPTLSRLKSLLRKRRLLD